MEFNRGLLYHVESLEQDDTYGDYIIGRIPEQHAVCKQQ